LPQQALVLKMDDGIEFKAIPQLDEMYPGFEIRINDELVALVEMQMGDVAPMIAVHTYTDYAEEPDSKEWPFLAGGRAEKWAAEGII
jgi:hypothetical protein